MPFTFSHPALIIPLKRLPAKYISMTGLVVGSIVPDFEKFIKLSGGNVYSHTKLGIFWFDLPLGLALAFIFHLVVRDTLITNLPLFFRKRLERYKGFNWTRHFKENPWTVALCIIIGSFLHISLDAFTHRESSYIYLIPFLLKHVTIGPIMNVGYVTLMWAVIVDLAFSIFGLLYIFYVFLRLPAEPVKPKATSSLLKFWAMVLLITSMIVALKLLLGGELRNSWQLIYIGIGAGLMGIFLVSAFWLKGRLS